MFLSACSYLLYIGYSLTALYPVLQSIRDDIAFDAFEQYKKRWGGYELFLFNLGMQSLCAAFLVAAYLIYDGIYLYIMTASLFFVYG